MRLIPLLLALLLAACAPLSQQVGRPQPTFQGPRLEADRFVSFDGARLGLMHWPAESGEPWAVIIGLHGMNDYANTFHLAAPEWAAQGIETYAYDQRGFGRSPGRGVWGGETRRVEDLRTYTALVRRRHPHAIIAVAGVSMGGSVAIEAFASEQPPAADRLVLLAPGVWGWRTQPLPNRLALWIAAHSLRGSVVKPPDFVLRHVRPSDNIQELRAMGRDPLMIWGARPDALYGLVNLMQDAADDIGRVRAPMIYMSGAHDEIISKKPTFAAARHLPRTARSAWYADGWHLLLIDRQRSKVIKDVAAFIRDPAAPLPSGVPPIPAMRAGDGDKPRRRYRLQPPGPRRGRRSGSRAGDE
jgi:alpha-beta hydrolase superfamily lysophospholipase